MFAGEQKIGTKIKKAVSFFSDYDTHKIHSRPIALDKLSSFGLKIEIAEDNLSNLLWEAYILLNGFFNSIPFIKVYENTHGVSWGKQLDVMIGPKPQQPKPQQLRIIPRIPPAFCTPSISPRFNEPRFF